MSYSYRTAFTGGLLDLRGVATCMSGPQLPFEGACDDIG